MNSVTQFPVRGRIARRWDREGKNKYEYRIKKHTKEICLQFVCGGTCRLFGFLSEYRLFGVYKAFVEQCFNKKCGKNMGHIRGVFSEFNDIGVASLRSKQ